VVSILLVLADVTLHGMRNARQTADVAETKPIAVFIKFVFIAEVAQINRKKLSLKSADTI
jgi:hypothetical protein